MNVSLAEYAETDAQWFWEVYTVLVAYQEGVQMRTAMESKRAEMQC